MDRFTRYLGALIAASALLSAQALGAGTPAQPMHGYGAGPYGGGGKWLAQMEALNLTPDQRQAVQDIADRYRVRGTDLAQRASGIRDQLLNVSPDDAGYAAATDKASETAAALAADGVHLLSELRAEVYAVLSEEQRQSLKERMTRERARWEEWRARHKAPQ